MKKLTFFSISVCLLAGSHLAAAAEQVTVIHAGQCRQAASTWATVGASPATVVRRMSRGWLSS
jgi:hypothetical protein